jgi:hypothetical protein
MTEPLALPETCARTLDILQDDPLALNPSLTAHLGACPACREARVLLLAQEETPDSLAPAGYFDRLPERILRKLPSRHRRPRLQPLGWAVAATLLVAVSAGAFWVGRANRTPYVEAGFTRTPSELQESLPEFPFEDNEDALTKLRAMSPEEAEAVLQALSVEQAPRPAQP